MRPPSWCARAWGVQGALNHRILRPASVGGVVPGSKGRYAMQALPALRTHAAKLRLSASVRRVWGLPPVRWVLNPAGAATVLRLWGQPHSELPWLCEVERGKGGACKAGTTASPQECSHRLPCRPESSAGRALCRAVSSRWGIEPRCSRGACCQGYFHQSAPNPNPPPNRSRRCPCSLKWPLPRRRPGLRSLSPNPQQPLNRLQGSQKRK